MCGAVATALTRVIISRVDWIEGLSALYLTKLPLPAPYNQSNEVSNFITIG
jgi:hypothetical protein